MAKQVSKAMELLEDLCSARVEVVCAAEAAAFDAASDALRALIPEDQADMIAAWLELDTRAGYLKLAAQDAALAFGLTLGVKSARAGAQVDQAFAAQPATLRQ